MSDNSTPRIPVISNLDAQPHSDPAVIKEILTKQVRSLGSVTCIVISNVGPNDVAWLQASLFSGAPTLSPAASFC
jgi:hypothetical protein